MMWILISGETVSFVAEGWWASYSVTMELQHSGEGVQEMCHQCSSRCNLCALKGELLREGEMNLLVNSK